MLALYFTTKIRNNGKGDNANTRKTRIWYPGAIYHIMQRGIRRKEIYTTEGDYQYCLALLEKELGRYHCTLHAYCFMTNHYHLLLETSDKEIWRFMKTFSQNYARYYNAQHAYTGHLFEGRYVSVLVEDDEYFLQVSRYIHLNPVKAHMCMSAEQYKYSSYRSIINVESDKVTNAEKTLKYFQDKSVIKYREFVNDIGHKYEIHEDSIKKSVGEDDLWLPW